MLQYFDKIVKGTEREDSLVILQSLRGMVGKRFSLLNYYKEIPVSYEVTLHSVEKEMAEFEVHEYQAKVMSLEKRTLIHSHSGLPFSEDLVSEVFYVSSVKKRAVLCNFGYARIRSNMRQFVRVVLDTTVEAELCADENTVLKGIVKDISLGGAAIQLDSAETLVTGSDVNVMIRLPENENFTCIINMSALILKVTDSSPYTCVVQFYPEKYSQQQIAHYINHRQVQIIKELKDIH